MRYRPELPPATRAVGRTGRIVGVDASAQMIAQASAKASRLGWVNIDLVHADATTLTPAWLRARPDQGRGTNGAEAVLSTYSLSLVKDWPGAWRAATAAARSGARVVVVDLRTPTGAATVLAPLARLACTLGGSDITAHPYPWTPLERDCTDVQAWSLRGGHIQVRAGPLASRSPRHRPRPDPVATRGWYPTRTDQGEA